MAFFTTHTHSSLLERIQAHVLHILSRAQSAAKPREIDGQAILDAQARAQEARARVDRLLG